MSGVVTDADGKPVDELCGRDVCAGSFPLGRGDSTATGQPVVRAPTDGSRSTTLPPGDYYAIALDRSDAIEGQDPEFLEGLTRLATAVSLAPGDTRTLELKLFTVQ